MSSVSRYFAAVQSDDVLLDAVVAAAVDEGEPVPGSVAAVLVAWRQDVDAAPVPALLDTDAAVAAIRSARR